MNLKEHDKLNNSHSGVGVQSPKTTAAASDKKCAAADSPFEK